MYFWKNITDKKQGTLPIDILLFLKRMSVLKIKLYWNVILIY
jgi:hypothetical protein